jgi:hypothetical protein
MLILLNTLPYRVIFELQPTKLQLKVGGIKNWSVLTCDSHKLYYYKHKDTSFFLYVKYLLRAFVSSCLQLNDSCYASS